LLGGKGSGRGCVKRGRGSGKGSGRDGGVYCEGGGEAGSGRARAPAGKGSGPGRALSAALLPPTVSIAGKKDSSSSLFSVGSSTLSDHFVSSGGPATASAAAAAAAAADADADANADADADAMTAAEDVAESSSAAPLGVGLRPGSSFWEYAEACDPRGGGIGIRGGGKRGRASSSHAHTRTFGSFLCEDADAGRGAYRDPRAGSTDEAPAWWVASSRTDSNPKRRGSIASSSGTAPGLAMRQHSIGNAASEMAAATARALAAGQKSFSFSLTLLPAGPDNVVGGLGGGNGGNGIGGVVPPLSAPVTMLSSVPSVIQGLACTGGRRQEAPRGCAADHAGITGGPARTFMSPMLPPARFGGSDADGAPLIIPDLASSSSSDR
jgi:hypothetical protein